MIKYWNFQTFKWFYNKYIRRSIGKDDYNGRRDEKFQGRFGNVKKNQKVIAELKITLSEIFKKSLEGINSELITTEERSRARDLKI